MFRDFCTALKKYRRLILLFLVTILMPSVVLGIFGINAIKNQQYRLIREFQEEEKLIADQIMTGIITALEDAEDQLNNLALHPALRSADPMYYDDLRKELNGIKILEQLFILEGTDMKTISFPPYIYDHSCQNIPAMQRLSDKQSGELRRAENAEYRNRRYAQALRHYNRLFRTTGDPVFQARLLNSMARVQAKDSRFEQAIGSYERLINAYGCHRTDAGIPLALVARLQIIACAKQLNDSDKMLAEVAGFYRAIPKYVGDLSQDQCAVYCGMASEFFGDIDPQETLGAKGPDNAIESIVKLQKETMQKFRTLKLLQEQCIPEMIQNNIRNLTDISTPIFYAREIDHDPFLLLAKPFPNFNGQDKKQILGFRICNDFLENEALIRSIQDLSLPETVRVRISGISGRKIYASGMISGASKHTAIFRDNFPPWFIEVDHTGKTAMGFTELRTSFYFWTIVVLIITLTFGSVMIIRTVNHEIQIIRMKSEFVSSVSHEFKTPLTSIKALTERLLSGKVSEKHKMREYYSIIYQDSERLARMVGNILDYAKIEEGKKSCDMQNINMNQWLEEIIRQFRQEMINKNVHVNLQLPETAPMACIDKNALTQAIINVLDNAVKFSGKGKSVHVRLNGYEGNVVIGVADQGIGIPPDAGDRIFEKFYRGSNAILETIRGTGMGLALVKHTVEAHGGRIDVDSELGKGSVFTISLPGIDSK